MLRNVVRLVAVSWCTFFYAHVGAAQTAMPLTAREELSLKPGDSFKECAECPEMVVVPSGRFMMGSSRSEIAALVALVTEATEDDFRHESPQHRVTIAKPFAVGKFEVTFAEWDACVTAGRCRHKPHDMRWGRDNRPVIDLSWNDITNEYLPWLSRRTGKAYRLLSEAEWEYAARGVTSASAPSTRYWWGDQPSHDHANYGDNQFGRGHTEGRDQWGNITAPVGQFPANPFGLHDMHGNVSEWVQDCWHAGYTGAPYDGTARRDGNCRERVIRGGSWVDIPIVIRSASRNHLPTGWRSTNTYGFRVARTLAVRPRQLDIVRRLGRP